ncbi:MAG TPA: amino acid ABC transporter permease [Thermomicrobiales bacterium]|nr:amino acid ABC transporter permease [Thermomicrobiales bacterium]
MALVEPIVAAAGGAGRELTDAEIAALLAPKPAWTRADVRRSVAIAVVSSVVFFGTVVFFLARSSGWEAVRQAFFSWPDFQAAFPKVLQGFLLNFKIFMIAEPIILAIGLLLAVVRSSRSPVFFPARAAAVTYIDIFRGAPSLLVVLTLGFGVPALRIGGVPNTAVFWGSVAIILTSSAYQAELFRAGIESVHASQRAAARSLGLSNSQALRYVVLPQAVRRVIPPTLSNFVALQKETALISVLGPLEATRQAQIYASLNFNFTSYVVAGLIFIAVTIPLARFTDYLLQRAAERRTIGGAV